MARESKSDDAPYFAVLRTGYNKLRVQYRSRGGESTEEEERDIPPDGIYQEGRCFLKLRVAQRGSATTVEGFGSQDGKEWKSIAQQTFSSALNYIGLAASSHDDENPDGTPVKYLFGNFRKDGNFVDAQDLTTTDIGTVWHSRVFNGFFP